MRWPISLFYLFSRYEHNKRIPLCQGYSQNPVIIKMKFLKGLAQELVQPLLYTRVKNPRRNLELSLMIKQILGKEMESQNSTSAQKKQN
ncbi:hypothetical protein CEXT_445631 [Caerostris extrusa]|uniref:Uncharacterized protein n=1 Tax=Caerostris extrusa TaxID=172846 RepID=A0AAV4QTF8_CAEEX|nr:hypothetical protein CEXT_445631 [Caerostris extrusa]